MHNTRAKGTTAAVQLALACCCLGMLLPRHMAGPSMLQTMEIHVRIRIGIPTYTCDYVHVKKYTCVIVHTHTNVHHMQKRTNTPGCAVVCAHVHLLSTTHGAKSAAKRLAHAF